MKFNYIKFKKRYKSIEKRVRIKMNTKPITIKNNEDGSNVNISQITDLSNLFFNNNKFNQNISKWNTSNRSHMRTHSKSNKNISKWNVSNVANRSSVFTHSKFNKDISKWNTRNNLTKSMMFYGI